MRHAGPDWSLDLDGVLGNGGFATVYRGVYVRGALERRIAAKVLKADQAETASIVARQRDEARLLAALDHPNVVRIYDLLTVEGRPCLVMEYVPGIDLDVLRKTGPLPPRVAAAVCARVAAALHAAYSEPAGAAGEPLRIVHRDVKPGNVMITSRGTVKLCDFGIASADSSVRESVTTALSDRWGTPSYTAPERMLHEESGAPCDVYSLGATFWALLTGKVPEVLPLGEAIFHKRNAERIRQLRDLGLTTDWCHTAERVLARMLAFEPTDRPTADEAEELLQRLADNSSGGALTLRRFSSTVVAPLVEKREVRPLPSQAPLVESTHVEPPPGTRTLARTAPMVVAGLVGAGGGLVVLVLLMGALWQLLPEKDPPPTLSALPPKAAPARKKRAPKPTPAEILASEDDAAVAAGATGNKRSSSRRSTAKTRQAKPTTRTPTKKKAPTKTSSPAPKSSGTPSEAPAPSAASPAPAPAPAAPPPAAEPPAPVTIALGASTWDGTVQIGGRTYMLGQDSVTLRPGVHKMVFLGGGTRLVHSVRVPAGATRLYWEVGTTTVTVE